MKPIDRMCPACKVPPGVGCLPFGVKPGCGYPMKGFHWERRNQRETKIAYPTPRDLQKLYDYSQRYLRDNRTNTRNSEYEHNCIRIDLIDRIAMLEHKLRGAVLAVDILDYTVTEQEKTARFL